jgi:uncharacterized membrane protein
VQPDSWADSISGPRKSKNLGKWATRLLVVVALCLTIPILAQAQTATPALGAAHPRYALAQQDSIQETLEARVLSAGEPRPCEPELGNAQEPVADPTAQPGVEPQRCQRVELLITKGSIAGQRVVVDEGRLPVASRATSVYRAGDRVVVDWLRESGQPSAFYIIDFIRTDSMLILALVFVGLAVAFGGLRGITSLIGLITSFGILLFFLLPRITAGDDPVIISIIGAFFIMVVTLYMSHGISLKTTAALTGTSISLIITGLLAWLAVDAIKLTGFGSEEAMYVQIAQGGAINLRGLLLGGIIIGALGVLDDITISQSAAAFELHNANPSLTWRQLFGHSINIGRDHIAATVNTLVLAYAGASLPLLVLFVTFSEPWAQVVNQEVVAEEVVRTLVGSIGLIASVPITTWLASMLAARSPVRVSGSEAKPPLHHHH